jgi:hypothetical protein
MTDRPYFVTCPGCGWKNPVSIVSVSLEGFAIGPNSFLLLCVHCRKVEFHFRISDKGFEQVTNSDERKGRP